MRLASDLRSIVANLVVAVSLVLSGCGDEPSPEYQADPVPLGITLQGDTLTTADLRGKVAVVMFWATWCSPCRRAFADLDSLWIDLAPSGRFALVAISEDTIEGDLESFLHDQSHPFQITRDIGAAAGLAFRLRALPTYVVLDTYGYTQWRKLGYQPRDTIEAVVASELDAQAR